MAKALLGHLGGPDPVVAAELARLRRRVDDLENEVDRLKTANEALTSLVADEAQERMLSVADREPVLT
jgi:cell division protein FtsB